MLNLNAVSGVKSTPLSKNILENSIGSNAIKDSRAFANYEFLVNSLTDGNFKAPSVLLASGNGSFYPKTASYQNDFYSSHILGRDGYMNIWQSNYLTNEDYSITYYDGYSLFKRFTIQHNTGKGLLKSLEMRNGNTSSESGLSQLILGHNLTPSIDEVGLYRHSIRTRHDNTNQGENAIDFFAWDPSRDTKTALGSRRVVSLNGAGNLEILNGCQIDGGVSLSIETPSETQIETNTLAVLGKGVMYYNSAKKRYRYSENGEPFKYFGGGGSNGFSSAIESTLPHRCVFTELPTPIYHQGNHDYSDGYAIALYAHAPSRIKSISVLSSSPIGGNLACGIYTDYNQLTPAPLNFTLHLKAYHEHISTTSHSYQFVQKYKITDFETASDPNIDINNILVHGFFYISFARIPGMTISTGMGCEELDYLDFSSEPRPTFTIPKMIDNFNQPQAASVVENPTGPMVYNKYIPYIRVELEEV